MEQTLCQLLNVPTAGYNLSTIKIINLFSSVEFALGFLKFMKIVQTQNLNILRLSQLQTLVDIISIVIPMTFN